MSPRPALDAAIIGAIISEEVEDHVIDTLSVAHSGTRALGPESISPVR